MLWYNTFLWLPELQIGWRGAKIKDGRGIIGESKWASAQANFHRSYGLVECEQWWFSSFLTDFPPLKVTKEWSVEFGRRRQSWSFTHEQKPTKQTRWSNGMRFVLGDLQDDWWGVQLPKDARVPYSLLWGPCARWWRGGWHFCNAQQMPYL